MTEQISGRVWAFGDDVNTDVMAPGLFFKAPIEEMARHCLEAVDPDFATRVQPGDIVIGGRNFGIGSAREQAAMCFQQLGVGAILAVSFGRIFYRNALNFGIPTLFFAQAGLIRPGERLRIDPVAGRIERALDGSVYQCVGLPQHLMSMVEAGGLLPYLKQKLAEERGQR
jgi:3-isopropylmalate/(R)-2-methylmalate dehydratase small subunit